MYLNVYTIEDLYSRFKQERSWLFCIFCPKVQLIYIVFAPIVSMNEEIRQIH